MSAYECLRVLMSATSAKGLHAPSVFTNAHEDELLDLASSFPSTIREFFYNEGIDARGKACCEQHVSSETMPDALLKVFSSLQNL